LALSEPLFDHGLALAGIRQLASSLQEMRLKRIERRQPWLLLVARHSSDVNVASVSSLAAHASGRHGDSLRSDQRGHRHAREAVRRSMPQASPLSRSATCLRRSSALRPICEKDHRDADVPRLSNAGERLKVRRHYSRIALHTRGLWCWIRTALLQKSTVRTTLCSIQLRERPLRQGSLTSPQSDGCQPQAELRSAPLVRARPISESRAAHQQPATLSAG